MLDLEKNRRSSPDMHGLRVRRNPVIRLMLYTLVAFALFTIAVLWLAKNPLPTLTDLTVAGGDPDIYYPATPVHSSAYEIGLPDITQVNFNAEWRGLSVVHGLVMC